MAIGSKDRDGQRQCRDRGEWKSLDDFHATSRRPDGRGSYCKPCFNLRAGASYARRVAAKEGREVRQGVKVPEGQKHCISCREIKPLSEFPRNRSDSTGYATYCKPCHNERGRESKMRLYGSTREYHLRRRYGMRQAGFETWLAWQGGVCAICGAPDPEHVDHDHEFGNVRGILCFNCNGGLGQFKDNQQSLARAIEYLRETACQRVLVHPGVYRLVSPRRVPRPSRTS